MKAVVLTEFGSAENLELQERNVPDIGPNDLLVKVYATSVNPADVGLRSGMFGAMMKTPLVLGFDVAGVVEQVGANVEAFHEGDEVYYAVELTDPRSGANAEYHAVAASAATLKPKNLSFAEAAAVPVAGGTAYAALITAADLRLGQRVLLHGAGGGVGTFAVQLAHAAGAFVIATCGSYDAELVSSLGADVVVDYRTEDFTEVVMRETVGVGVDVALDAAGGKLVAPSIGAVRPGGKIVTVTGAQGDLNPAMRRNISVSFVHLENAKEKLGAMRNLFEWGRLKSVISHTYPLTEVADAHRKLESGGEDVYGKIVIKVV